MAKPPPTKTKTRPGLGILDSSRGVIPPKPASAEMERVRDSIAREEPDDAPPESQAPESTQGAAAPKRVRDSIRREDPDDGAAPLHEDRLHEPRADGASKPPASRRPSSSERTWKSEPPTTTRSKTPRPPLSVDKVGDAAVKMAGHTRGQSAPRLVATRDIIARAPIDARTAFILSLVDGVNSVDTMIDISGMPADDVKGVLARLTRLGLISGV